MRQVVVVAALLAAAAAPMAGKAQPTSVAITVPPAQRLEGSTSHHLLPGVAQSGLLTVASNIPWSLGVDITGGAAVWWRPAGASGWTALPAQGPVLAGPRGVHRLAYEIRASAPASVRFTVAIRQ